ncbi:unnamed protein product, partial [Phaeothamnion confervicola]
MVRLSELLQGRWPALTLHRHLLIFAFVIALPALAFSSYVLSRFAHSEREQFDLRLIQTASDLAADIDRDLQAMLVTVKTLSTSRALRTGAFEDFFLQSEESVAGTDLRVGLLTPGLDQVFTTLRPFGTILPRPNDVSTLAKALQSKAPQISDMVIGSVSGIPAFNVVFPVVDNGKVQHLIRLGFDADRLAKLLQAQDLSPGWVTGVTDRQGIVIARSHGQTSFVGQPMPSALQQRSQETRRVFEATNLEGRKVLRAVVRIPTSGWIVAATVDLPTVNSASSKAWWTLTLGGSGLLALAALLAALYARGLASGLSRAAASARALGRGESVARTPTSLISEVDSISDELVTAS